MRTLKGHNSGQALIEMAFVAPLLLVFVFGLVDFSRAMYDLEVITNLAGEGSSQASRTAGGTLNQSLATAAAAVMTDADINMNGKGCAILTAVQSPASGSYKVLGQVSSAPCNGGASQVGSCNPNGQGFCTGSATVPASIQAVLDQSTNITIYITEVTYNYSPVTPIGALLHKNNWLPSQLYRAAYY